MKSNLTAYLDTLNPDELQTLRDIAEAAYHLKLTGSDAETLQLYEEVLQPVLQARASDGWLFRWWPVIYYN